jgi:hypothetical protein
LANIPENTNANQIGLDWIEPVFNGGSPVIDYRVWYDDATNGETFTVFASGIVD